MDETLTGEVILSVLKVAVTKPALYTCLASNRHSAGANTVKATARVTIAGSGAPLLFPPPPTLITKTTAAYLCVCVREVVAASS